MRQLLRPALHTRERKRKEKVKPEIPKTEKKNPAKKTCAEPARKKEGEKGATALSRSWESLPELGLVPVAIS